MTIEETNAVIEDIRAMLSQADKASVDITTNTEFPNNGKKECVITVKCTVFKEDK